MYASDYNMEQMAAQSAAGYNMSRPFRVYSDAE
jgi:hypothetical protein